MRAHLHCIIQAALAAVDPGPALRRHLQREGHTLQVGDRSYDLRRFRRVVAVGAGKAGAPMAAALESILGDYLSGGLVSVKYGHAHATPGQVQVVQADHPVPDASGAAAAERVLALAASLGADDLLICLLSGGGSALLPAPAPGLTLDHKQAATTALLRSGATINEMNAVRKHLSAIKGGQLARAAHPATVITCILSDVVGSPLEVIASGPTVPDSSTYAEALAVLARYGLEKEVPPTVWTHLRRGAAGQLPETPKPGDPLFQRVQTLVVADNAVAAQAAVEEARRLGYHSLLLSTFVEGEAREVARTLAALGKEVVRSGQPAPRPACLVAGGETTVTVRGAGRGGRNQELALAAALALEGWNDVALAAVATDGSDGPTDSSGAIVSGATAGRARAMGLDPRQALEANDAYPFFKASGEGLFLGPTQTNVNDLTLILVR
ncbi:MAG: glycerate kinase [Chloroflexi bacterium]|nr:glycerate kinase [Chloroflexota bacterium]